MLKCSTAMFDYERVITEATFSRRSPQSPHPAWKVRVKCALRSTPRPRGYVRTSLLMLNLPRWQKKEEKLSGDFHEICL